MSCEGQRRDLLCHSLFEFWYSIKSTLPRRPWRQRIQILLLKLDLIDMPLDRDTHVCKLLLFKLRLQMLRPLYTAKQPIVSVETFWSEARIVPSRHETGYISGGSTVPVFSALFPGLG
jgi:hypothetical protein